MTPTRGLIALLTGFALALVAQTAPVPAHDHDHPELDGWYQSLKSGKGPCCDGPSKDALHLKDVDWETEGEDRNTHYRVKVPKDAASFERAIHGEAVDTVWVDVPDDAVIHDPNRAGSTLVWPLYGYGYPSITIRCFMPGTMT